MEGKNLKNVKFTQSENKKEVIYISRKGSAEKFAANNSKPSSESAAVSSSQPNFESASETGKKNQRKQSIITPNVMNLDESLIRFEKKNSADNNENLNDGMIPQEENTRVQIYNSQSSEKEINDKIRSHLKPLEASSMKTTRWIYVLIFFNIGTLVLAVVGIALGFTAIEGEKKDIRDLNSGQTQSNRTLIDLLKDFNSFKNEINERFNVFIEDNNSSHAQMNKNLRDFKSQTDAAFIGFDDRLNDLDERTNTNFNKTNQTLQDLDQAMRVNLVPRLTQLEDQSQTILLNMTDLNDSFTIKTNNLINLTNNVTDLSQRFEKSFSLSETIDSKLVSINDSIKDLNTNQSLASQYFANQFSNLSMQTKSQIEFLNQSLSSQTDEFSNLKSNFSNFQESQSRSLMAFNQSLIDLKQSQVVQMNSLNQSFVNFSLQIKAQLDGINQNVSVLSANFSNLNTNYSDFQRSQISSLTVVNQNLQSQSSSLSSINSSLSDFKQAQSDKTNSLNQSITSQNDKISSMDSTLSQMKDFQAVATQNISTVNATLIDLKQTQIYNTNSLNQSITSLNDKISSINSTLSPLKDSQAVATQNISNLNTTFNDFKQTQTDKTNQLNQSISTQNDKISALSTTVNQLKDLQNQTNQTITAQLTTINSSLNNSMQNISNLQTAVKSKTSISSFVLNKLNTEYRTNFTYTSSSSLNENGNVGIILANSSLMTLSSKSVVLCSFMGVVNSMNGKVNFMYYYKNSCKGDPITFGDSKTNNDNPVVSAFYGTSNDNWDNMSFNVYAELDQGDYCFELRASSDRTDAVKLNAINTECLVFSKN